MSPNGVGVSEMPKPGVNIGSSDHNSVTADVKLIAFYLPQYHPIPENDEWWGKGFTEWTNVTTALPQFDGHYQPRLPADLGFYDLRLRQIRHQQIDLAEKYGIYGFCYHYYWFSGTKLLEHPIEDMLSDVESDMPFCICWANESWTRRWDAREHEVLLGQKYLPGDDVEFIKGLIPFFQDSRYIRLNGAPLLIVYRPQQLPDSRKTTKIWREYCEGVGIPEIHLCAALTHGNEEYIKYGFDSGVQFPPHNFKMPSLNTRLDLAKRFRGRVFNYYEIADSYLTNQYNDDLIFRTVFPSWDNTARRKNSPTVVLNGTPENYEYWLSATIKITVEKLQRSERLVFINAWNEWAEGCYLEPDQKFGNSFLESTLRAMTGKSTLSGFQHKDMPDRFSKIERRTLTGDLKYTFGFNFDLVRDRIRIFRNSNPRIMALMMHFIKLFRKVFY